MDDVAGRRLSRPLLEQPDEEERAGNEDSSHDGGNIALEEAAPYGSDWVQFLVLHYVPFCAQVAIAVLAFDEGEGERLVLWSALAAYAFSSLVYSLMAWHTEAPGVLIMGLLPLKKQPLPLACLLLVPYALLQWIVVNLHKIRDDNFHAVTSRLGEHSGLHLSYKAVDAIVVFTLISGAMLYKHWTLGHVQSLFEYRAEEVAMFACWAVIVASGSMGLLHVDYNTSDILRERMKRKRYVLCHGVYRSSEVVSRLAVLTGCLVLARTHSRLWFIVPALDVLASTMVVLFVGGLRNTRLACCITILSSTVFDVFRFLDGFLFPDSQGMYESARIGSLLLASKHLLECVLAVLAAVLLMDLRQNLKTHGVSLCLAFLAMLLHWILWFFTRMPWSDEEDPQAYNIFTAVRRGDLKEVEKMRLGQLVTDVNDPDPAGMTPLMLAALAGDADMCECLLDLGALRTLKARETEGSRAVLVEDRWADLFLLLRRLVWHPAGRQWTALHLAAWKGHTEALATLLRKPAPLDEEQALIIVDADGNTPLHVAHKFGKEDMVARLRDILPRVWEQLCNAEGARPQLPRRAAGTRGLRRTYSVQPEDIPVTSDDTECYEVPLGLSSSFVCASSGQAWRLFFPKPLKFDGERPNVVGQLSFEEIRPCRVDGTVVEGLRSQDPESWEDPAVNLGRGQFGRVWRGIDREGRLLAVKCVTKFGMEHECRAMREAQVALAVRGLPHPCLVTVFLYHHLSSDFLCIVTELCAAGSLQRTLLQHCRAYERDGDGLCRNYVPPELTYRYLSEAFLGLEYVHMALNGVVRDLKPLNIGLTGDHHAKLLDFGSYRLTGASRGHFSFGDQPAASAGYAAPELLRGEAYDHRVDFYSLGAMAWVLLTGGVSNDALPPLAVARPGRAKDCWDDYKLLRAMLARQRPAVPNEARELVAQLTEPRPRGRGKHERIREQLGALLGRELPGGEDVARVERWLEV